jgi:hypothetical protein
MCYFMMTRQGREETAEDDVEAFPYVGADHDVVVNAHQPCHPFATMLLTMFG